MILSTLTVATGPVFQPSEFEDFIRKSQALFPRLNNLQAVENLMTKLNKRPRLSNPVRAEPDAAEILDLNQILGRWPVFRESDDERKIVKFIADYGPEEVYRYILSRKSLVFDASSALKIEAATLDISKVLRQLKDVDDGLLGNVDYLEDKKISLLSEIGRSEFAGWSLHNAILMDIRRNELKKLEMKMENLRNLRNINSQQIDTLIEISIVLGNIAGQQA